MSTTAFDQLVRDELHDEDLREIRREERERDAQDAKEAMADRAAYEAELYGEQK